MRETAAGRAMRDRLTLLAMRPEGVSTGELTEFDRSEVSRMAWRMSSQLGRLYRGGRGHLLRFFCSPVDAANYSQESAAEVARKAKEIKQECDRRIKERKKPGPKPKLQTNSALPGVTIKHYGTAPWPKDAQPVITSKTKVTLCWSPPHFGPAAKIHGVGLADQSRAPAHLPEQR